MLSSVGVIRHPNLHQRHYAKRLTTILTDASTRQTITTSAQRIVSRPYKKCRERAVTHFCVSFR